MNKGELVSALVDKLGDEEKVTKLKATKFLEAFQAVVMDELAKGGKVSIVGFGTFDVLERAAHTGTRPGTKEKIEIPASKSPRFKAGKALKDAVNGR